VSDKSITEGSLIRPLFHLAWPIVVIQLLQVMYNVVDTLYLGRLSAEAVGAISPRIPLIFLLIAVAGGFDRGRDPRRAVHRRRRGRVRGARRRPDYLQCRRTLGTHRGRRILLHAPGARDPAERPRYGGDGDPLAADYMEVIFAGIPLMFGFFVFSALMRGYGDTRTPMAVMVVSVFLNVLLDPFLIFGFSATPLFGWLAAVPLVAALDPVGLQEALFAATGFTGFGIEGAAMATILFSGVATAIGLWLLFATGLGPAVSLSHLRPDRGFIEDIFRLGLPSSVEQTTSALAMITLTAAMVVTFSPPVVAAYGPETGSSRSSSSPRWGSGRAIDDTMVGQNLGANRADRAARSVKLAASTGAGVMFLVAIVAVTFTEPIVGVFLGDVPDAPATIASAVEYVQIRSVEFAFIGVSQVILGAFRGAGNTKTAMMIRFLHSGSDESPAWPTSSSSLAGARRGSGVGMALGNILGATVAVAWFARGTWTERYIDDPAPGVDPAVDD